MSVANNWAGVSPHIVRSNVRGEILLVARATEPVAAEETRAVIVGQRYVVLFAETTIHDAQSFA